MASLWHWVEQIVLIALHWDGIFSAIMGGGSNRR